MGTQTENVQQGLEGEFDKEGAVMIRAFDLDMMPLPEGMSPSSPEAAAFADGWDACRAEILAAFSGGRPQAADANANDAESQVLHVALATLIEAVEFTPLGIRAIKAVQQGKAALCASTRQTVGAADAGAGEAKPQISPLPSAPDSAPTAGVLACAINLRSAGRMEDMNPDGFMRVSLDAENDVVVSVFDGRQTARVEFCTPGSGGGRSRETRQALLALIAAMARDNDQSPSLAVGP